MGDGKWKDDGKVKEQKTFSFLSYVFGWGGKTKG